MERIGILGAGFGGLRAALNLHSGLRKRGLLKDYEVVLIDRNANHTYTPLLYKLAAKPGKATDMYAAAVPVKKIIGSKIITFWEDRVEKIDVMTGMLTLREHGEQTFKYLVLAPGLESNFFGIPGLAENSVPLKGVEDAKRIREILSGLPMDAHILVGGAGPNGVELAAEIKKASPRRTVTLIEAMPTILPGFPENVQTAVSRRLKDLRVEIAANEPITAVTTANAVSKSGREFHFGLFVWTGGVKAPELIANLPLKREARGRIVSNECMECLPEKEDLEFEPMIYAMGDIVSFIDPVTKKPVPGMARHAILQANIVSRNILSEIEGKPAHTLYIAKQLPYVIPVGGKWALAKIGPAVITGFLAWLFKEAIELNYFLEIMSWGRALKTLWKGLKL